MNWNFLNNEMNFCNAAKIELEQAKKRRWAISRFAQAREWEEAHKPQGKYCPHCHIQMSLLGECDICGYTHE